jgi:hypothetical protein
MKELNLIRYIYISDLARYFNYSSNSSGYFKLKLLSRGVNISGKRRDRVRLEDLDELISNLL